MTAVTVLGAPWLAPSSPLEQHRCPPMPHLPAQAKHEDPPPAVHERQLKLGTGSSGSGPPSAGRPVYLSLPRPGPGGHVTKKSYKVLKFLVSPLNFGRRNLLHTCHMLENRTLVLAYIAKDHIA